MKISHLWFYPIKSCGGISARQILLRPKGPLYDRMFVLCDPEGNFLSQRKLPQMAAIATAIVNYDGSAVHEDPSAILQVSVSSTNAHFIPMNEGQWVSHPTAFERDIRIHDDVCRGMDLGDVHAKWFSDVLGLPCRLVRQLDRMQRMRDASAVGRQIEVSYADGYPVLALSEASVEDLNRRLVQGGHNEVTYEPFRPNIVLSDCEAYAEDTMGTVSTGRTRFAGVKQCSRCIIVNVDQKTGVIAHGREPLMTLASYRRQGKGVMFGMNCLVTEPGIVSVSDIVVHG